MEKQYTSSNEFNKNSILELINRNRILIEDIENWLADAPPGSIHIRKRGNSEIYTLYDTNADGRKEERYMQKKDRDCVETFLKKKYYEKLLPVLKKEDRALSAMFRWYDPSAKQKLTLQIPAEYRSAVGIREFDPQARRRMWENAPYIRNSYPLPDVSFTTPRGKVVRSRAEYIIACIIEEHDLAYRTEEALHVSPGQVLYTDFSILSPRNWTVYYIEFFGMMGDPEYAARAFRKIKQYHQSPFAANFIPLFDAPGIPFDPAEFESIIRTVII